MPPDLMDLLGGKPSLTPEEIKLKRYLQRQKSVAAQRKRAFEEEELKYKKQRDIEDRIASSETRLQEDRRIKLSGRAQRVSEIRTTMNTIDWLKPVLAVVGVIILVFGFGIPSLLAIFEAMSWPYWLLGLFAALIFWRSY